MRALLMSDFTLGARLLCGDGEIFPINGSPTQQIEHLADVLFAKDITDIVVEAPALLALEKPVNNILRTKFNYHPEDWVSFTDSNYVGD